MASTTLREASVNLGAREARWPRSSYDIPCRQAPPVRQLGTAPDNKLIELIKEPRDSPTAWQKGPARQYAICFASKS